MDVLWSPWRNDYVTSGGAARPDGCIFCEIINSPASDEERFILKRAKFNFVILNIYPYSSGHLMIMPYEHISSPDAAGKETTDELMDLTVAAQTAITEVYSPDGINLGMNLGKAAGAGVDAHYHMHVLPRWVGDVNFMTAIGQTRIIPETLQTTYEKLKGKL